MYCVNCGNEINDNAKFCPFCGENAQEGDYEAEINSGPANRYEEEDPTNRKTGRPRWILPVCVIAAIAVCVGVFFFSGVFQNNTDNETPIPPVNSISESPSIVYPAPVFTLVNASSTRDSMGSINYLPIFVIDNDWSTAWCEGVAGAGIGEWIELSSNSLQHVAGIQILNGYFKSKELYDINNTISKALITTDTGDYSWELSHSNNGFQKFRFPSAIDTYRIRITIEAVDAGGDGLDTLISEIQAF